jgi:hypothetical protein
MPKEFNKANSLRRRKQSGQPNFLQSADDGTLRVAQSKTRILTRSGCAGGGCGFGYGAC